MGSEDVLVQVLATTDAEEEAAGSMQAGRRSGVGDDRRVDPDQRAGDARPQGQVLRHLRDATDHAPDERALTLLVDPRVVVVRDHRELEAGLLRQPRVPHEVVGGALRWRACTDPRHLQADTRRFAAAN